MRSASAVVAAPLLSPACGRRWASCQRRSDEGYSGGTLARSERVERSLALLRKAPHLTCCAGHLLPQGEKKDKLDSLTIRTYSYYSSHVIFCRTSSAAGLARGDPRLERFFASPLSRNWNRCSAADAPQGVVSNHRALCPLQLLRLNWLDP
jgi:hypothetical protein